MKYKERDEVMRPDSGDSHHYYDLLEYLGNGLWKAWEFPWGTTTPVKIHESEFISFREWQDKRLIELIINPPQRIGE